MTTAPVDRPYRTIRQLLPVLVLLAMPACRDGDGAYFPLDGSRTWEYEARRSIRGEHHTQRLVVASMPAVRAAQGTIYPQRRIDGLTYLYRHDDDGIFRTDDAGTKLARILPGKIRPGQKWQEPGRVLFLEVTGAFKATFDERAQNLIPLEYVIEATDDVVETRAGRFNNCLRVKSTGSMFAGATLREFMGIRFIKVLQTEWYAPGVGLVKRVRQESTTPAEWNNEYQQELIASF